MKAIIGTTLAALAVTAASADERSANFLMPGCRAAAGLVAVTTANVEVTGICTGVVWGVADMLSRSSSCPVCINVPEGVTYEQMVRVVIKYIEARPESMHKPFPGLAAQALVSTWGKPTIQGTR
jgi:hypothetical protein